MEILKIFLKIKNLFMLILLTVTVGGCVGKIKGTVQSLAPSLLESEFYLDPANLYMAVGQTQQLSFKNAQEPVSFKLQMGTGEIDSFGNFIATEPSEVMIKATDASGKTTYALIVVSDLPIIRGISKVTVGSLAQVAVSGGRSPYVFSIFDGQGQIDSQTGEFIAPANAGTSKIKVTDANGVEAIKEIEILPAISFSKSIQTVGANSVVSVSAAGGVGPLQYEVLGNGGTINPNSGEFTANGNQGIEVIKVTDAVGNVSYAYVTISSGSTSTSLTVSPSTAILGQGQKQKFSVVNGRAPFTLRLKSGIGSVDSQLIEYSAPTDSAGAAVVEIKDADDILVDVSITVTSQLSAGLENSSTVLVPGGTLQLTPSGGGASGSADYSFSATLGSITQEGLYTAPASGGTDVIKVTDKNGYSEILYVAVRPVLALAPSSAFLNVNSVIPLFAIGGAEPYSYKILSGEGQLEENFFKASSNMGQSVVEVTDSLGAKAQSQIVIVDKLEVNPFYKILVSGQTQTLTVSGGVEPYTLNLSGASPVGALQKVSETEFTFQAATVSQRTNQEIVITDSQSNSVNVTLVVNPILSLNAARLNLTSIESAEAEAIGGIGPYQFSTSDSGVLELIQLSSTRLQYKALQVGTANLVVTDSQGQSATRTIIVSQDYSIPPVATATGLPTQVSQQTSLTVNIGTATNSSTPVTHYKYKIGVSASTDCSQASGYSAEQSVANSLNLNIGALADGEIKFCVLGRNNGSDGSNGTFQLLALATQYSWSKDTVGPTVTVSQPANLSWSNLQNYRALPITGTCESGQNVLVGGGVTASIPCSNSSFSGTLDLLNVVDGSVALSFNQSDSAGNAASAVNLTINKDVTSPTVPTNLLDGSVSPDLNTSPNITWTAATDVTSGISYYEISLGTAAGAQNTKAWTSIGNVSSTTVSGLNLTNDQQYFVNLRAVDSQGNISTIVSSDGFTAKSLSLVSVSPTQSNLTGGGTLTLSGSGFVSGATVKIGSLDCGTPTVVSSSSITCVIPLSTVTGTFDVNLTNGDSNTSSLSNVFSYLNVTDLNLDPYWSDVVYLNHFDGANGASTIEADELGQASTVAVGTPAYGTPSQFGPTSLNIQGEAGIQVTPNGNFNLQSGDFTIEGWLYFTSAPASFHMGIFQTAGYGSGNLTLRNFNGSLQLFYDDAGSGELFIGASPTMNTSTWYHYAVVKEGDLFSLYFNGTRVSSDAKTHSIQVGDFRIGCERTFCFRGHMDEFRVTKRARYSGDNYAVPTMSFADSKTGVVFLNHFEGADGSSDLTDALGQAPTSIRGSPLIKTDQKMFGNSSLYIGGTYLDDNHSNPGNNAWAQWSLNSFDMQYRDFTVEFWFKPEGSGGNYIASFGKYQVSAPYNSIAIRNDSKVHIVYRDWSDYYTSPGVGYSLTEWHHVAWVKKGAVISVYVDGTLNGTVTNFQNWNQQVGGLTLGKMAYYNGSAFTCDANGYKGWFDEARVVRGRALYQGASFAVPTMPFHQ